MSSTRLQRFRSVLADTRPLRNPAFRRLWIADIVTVVGAQLTIVSVPAQIYAQTRDSSYVGLTGLFGLVPLIVFGLYGGSLADAHDRRRILLFTSGGLVVASALFWAQAAAGGVNVWVLLYLFAAQQALFALHQPALQSSLPRLLEPELLPAANSLLMTVAMAGGIAGPLLAGALIPVLGFSWMYAIDTICLLSTLWAVFRMPALPPIGEVVKAGFSSVLDGLRYLTRHPVLLASFVVDLIAMVFGMPRSEFPQIAHESFGGPLGGGFAFAWLFAAIPVGAVLGGVFSGWVSRVRRHGVAVLAAVLVWGLAIIGFGAAVALANGRVDVVFWLAFIALVIGGAADMVSAAFRTSMLQTAASDEVRGRLQGVFLVVVAGGPRIADVIHGAGATAIGAATTAWLGGVCVVIGVVLVGLLVPSFRRYRLAA